MIVLSQRYNKNVRNTIKLGCSAYDREQEYYKQWEHHTLHAYYQMQSFQKPSLSSILYLGRGCA
jgi:hypothetical protein